ncbi:MAG: hypothetical protein J5867_00615 [Prevotella sp.]|nr:hypothetical protein [Prevotella sp.]
MRKMALAMIAICVLTMLCVGCHNTGQQKGMASKSDSDTAMFVETVIDSTVYGTCGEATSMHTLQLITDMGDTLFYSMMVEEDADIQGGLLVGDRMAVIGKGSTDGLVATRVINLTTLMGKWTSLDKNFEILEGGVVESNVQVETNPWTTWKILNGQLLLNADTFTINELGADSLYIENDQGIFTYKRQK